MIYGVKIGRNFEKNFNQKKNKDVSSTYFKNPSGMIYGVKIGRNFEKNFNQKKNKEDILFEGITLFRRRKDA
ncbi:hypothetical protein BAU16_03275 [Enterococcus sp. JM9B]|nr:hypothetical protein BAU16_03275 [Enterococcus sp. JM9B]